MGNGERRATTRTHIINNVTLLFKINRVDDYPANGSVDAYCEMYAVVTFIISIFFIAIEVLRLSSVPGIYLVSYNRVDDWEKCAYNGRIASHSDGHRERAIPLRAAIGARRLAPARFCMHLTHYILLSRNLAWVPRIISENDHVLLLIPKLSWK